MFRRILIPIDGSEHGDAALGAAVTLARRTGAELLALYVEPDTAGTDQATTTSETEARMRRTVEELRASGVSVKIIFGSGRPQDGILTAIWEQHPSLVVLAPHHRHGLEALRHPSTTQSLIAQAHAPLLIWPGTMPPQACDEWLTQADSLVIVPLDGSKLAEQAIPFAERFAAMFDRTLLLFRAIPPVLMPGIGLHVAQFERQALAAEEHEALHYLREVQHSHISPTSGVRVDTMIGAGDPSSAILDLTNSHPGSLIAMSTRGRSAFARFILGSVTIEVLRRTCVPLLIIPPHQYAFAPAPEPAKEQGIVPVSSLEFGDA